MSSFQFTNILSRERVTSQTSTVHQPLMTVPEFQCFGSNRFGSTMMPTKPSVPTVSVPPPPSPKNEFLTFGSNRFITTMPSQSNMTTVPDVWSVVLGTMTRPSPPPTSPRQTTIVFGQLGQFRTGGK